MSVVLKVENLSKQYRLGLVGTGTLSHDLNRWWHKVRGKEDPYLKVGEVNDRSQKGGEYVWALKDINFEVKQGEVLGIIGKNGAGKSTLLKILSQVTNPTTGSVKVKGRIASLLEVGTGFHPELTGRENIFLNGAILGMTKAEIKSKLDEIVDFSGVAKYVDTPVKRYSSGMMVRLGFAVAAHLEPEILVVDEVLAVGDAEFQKKCLGKMQDVSKQGRTVLFVSHNMGSVKSLCTQGILLKNGLIAETGSIKEVVEAYIAASSTRIQSGIVPEGFASYDTGEASIRQIHLLNRKGQSSKDVFYQSPIHIRLHLEIYKELKDVIIDIRITSREGIELTHSMNKYEEMEQLSFKPGSYQCNISLQNSLQPGNYSVTAGIHYGNGSTINYLENILDFTVLNTTEEGDGDYTFAWTAGYMRIKSDWKISNHSANE